MPAEVKKEIALEIAHVLFIDIVAYSKMGTDDQRAAIEKLNQIVQSTDEFRKAESEKRLLKLATGDGIALIFYHSPEDPLVGPIPIEILARVAARMGEPDRAIAALQKLLSIPSVGPLAANLPLTPALLRLDPMFDPLRNDPRFQKLAASPAPK